MKTHLAAKEAIARKVSSSGGSVAGRPAESSKVCIVVLCCGVVWCGVVWCGVVCCGVVWCVVLCYAVLCYA
jgi:hypothetical protein